MVLTTKFSSFASGNLTDNTNQEVGLSGGLNAKFAKVTEWTTLTRPNPPFDGLMGYNTTTQLWEYYNLSLASWVSFNISPALLATYILNTPSTYLPNAQSLSLLTTGIMKSTSSTGVISISSPLTSIDSLTTSSDKMIYTTSSNVYATTTLTAFSRGFLASSSASVARTALGLGQAAVKNVSDNSQANVSSTIGPFTTGHVLIAGDTGGSVKDGGSPAGMGTVMSVASGTGLTGTPNPITNTGTISLTIPVDVTSGGTGNTTFTEFSVLCAGTSSTSAFQNVVGVGSSNQVLVSNGVSALPTWQSVPGLSPASLTKTDDTNVTLSLGGTPATSLLQAVSLTLGWTGTLAPTRGGTGISTYTLGDTIYSSAANTLAKLSGNTTVVKQYLSQTGDGANSAAPSWATISGGDITGAALSKTDDTNVTLTLGGTPTTSLLRAASITAGWTGQLGLTRGGTASSLTASNGGIVYSTASALAILSGTATANLPLLSGSSTTPSWSSFALSLGGALTTAGAHTLSGAFGSTFIFTNTTSVTFPTSGTLATTSQIPTGAALTKTDDTNVTLSLGGSPTTALVNAASLTLGWTGQLSVDRGGTGLAALTAHDLIIGNGTSAATLLAPSATSGVPLISQGAAADPAYGTAVVAGGGTGAVTFTAYSVLCGGTAPTAAFQSVASVGTSGQVLSSNGPGALPSWATIPGATSAALTKTDDTNVTLTLGGAPTTALLTAASITAGWTGQLGLTRGGTAASLTASNGGIVYSTASALAILSATATAGQIIRSGASAAPTWSTSTYPATNAVSTLLYASSTNVMAALATANSSILVTDSGGVPAWSTTLPAHTTSSITFNPTTGGIVGTTTNDNAAAGKVGEVISSQITSGSPVTLSNNVAADITSISLTAGDWDVFGNAAQVNNTGTVSYQAAWSNTTSATQPDASLCAQVGYSHTGNNNTVTIPTIRYSVASPTTVYLSIQMGFTVNCKACGILTARRAR